MRLLAGMIGFLMVVLFMGQGIPYLSLITYEGVAEMPKEEVQQIILEYQEEGNFTATEAVPATLVYKFKTSDKLNLPNSGLQDLAQGIVLVVVGSLIGLVTLLFVVWDWLDKRRKEKEKAD